MNNYTVNASQITPNKYIWIRGRLTFSRVASKIEGDELSKMNERKRIQGRKDITEKPHTTATISNAEIIPQTPGELTLEEKFIAERMGVSTKNPQLGNYYTAINKGNSLPKVGVLTPENKYVETQMDKRELQNGLDVTLVIRTFKGNPNNGTALDGIIINEPIRFYEPANLGLGQRGIEAEFLSGVPEITPNASAQAPTPVPTQAPMQPTQTPYSVNPNVGYNPAAQQASVTNHQPYNPAAQPYNPAQGYAAMPVPPAQGGQAPGIRYDGQDRPY